MSDFVTVQTENFSTFLTDNSAQIKKNNSGILSYAIELPADKLNINADFLFSKFNTGFYYEKPEFDFFIYGADPILELNENGEGRFAVIDKKIRDLKKNFISNWEKFSHKDFPLFTGGMKFTVEHPDADWKEFNDSSWFIPEILFQKMQGKYFFIFNVQLPISRDALIRKFKQKLTLVLNQSDELLNFALRVSRINGNSPKEKKKWKSLVTASLDKISAGEINKIVLSRVVELQLLDELTFNSVLDKFRNKFPSCTLFIYKRNRSVFFGASPERLAAFRNTKVELDALAGSSPRGTSKDEDITFEKYLFTDEKIQSEHKFVVKHLNSIIKNHLDEIITEEPSVLKLENIQHLLTKISGFLKDENCMFNLIKDIFPTPAVCGYPKERSMQLIKKIEEHQRGLYAGIIGWFNLTGNAEFTIAIRSALYSNKRLLAYAGSGIVESSVPDDEFRETELKLQSIISLFNENKN